MNKSPYIPRLRFPEFRTAPAWEEKRLGEVVEVLNNRRKPVTEIDRKKGIYPYYGASGIQDYVKEYLFDEPLVLVGEDGAKWGQYENTAFIAEGRYWVNNHAHVLRFLGSLSFLENWLIYLDLSPFVTGAAPPKLTLGNLKKIPVPFPALPEQQKIAECLSSLDLLIEATSEKVEQLKAYKKGLMQKLFPREGETIPRLRFPEFHTAPAWEEKRLGDVANISAGNGAPQGSKYFEGGKIPFVRTSDVGKVHLSSSFYEASDYVNDKAITEKRLHLFSKGCILFPKSGASIFLNHRARLSAPAYVSSHLAVIEAKRARTASLFLYNILSCVDAGELVPDNSYPSLGIAELENVLICLPSLLEQEKLAECLSSLDDLITATLEKAEQLKSYKKGLMQQLFP